MVADGVARGQVRQEPRGGLVEVRDVFMSRLYDGPRCWVEPLPGQIGLYRAELSTSYVRRWPCVDHR